MDRVPSQVISGADGDHSLAEVERFGATRRVLDHPYVHRGMAWVNRLRLRVIVFVIGIPLAAWGAIMVGPAWLAIPLVGVAVACVTMSVNRLTQRLAANTCFTCGSDLSGMPPHEHGIACPNCGSLNQYNPASLAQAPAESDDSKVA